MSLARYLRHLPFLSSLSLSACQIHDAGAGLVGSVLYTNSRIFELRLSHNQIADEGLELFASWILVRGLRSNIGRIKLDANLLGDGSVHWLKKAMQTKRSLTDISLRGNNLSRPALRVLSEAVGCLTSPRLSLPRLNLTQVMANEHVARLDVRDCSEDGGRKCALGADFGGRRSLSTKEEEEEQEWRKAQQQLRETLLRMGFQEAEVHAVLQHCFNFEDAIQMLSGNQRTSM
ncbi:hypothetical protein GUITHDRAFT_146124 [Guillardia theta CCMP2712]|uniref:UBA domain-containing protein n=1 Tax=Guillardia theta (strain CCMP2712) TaxID=905079 RepID=L1II97_GUITC|nr:hypothetical protein GUITHDRAFT_146124 [Guillardia theta CCMP2712]EKX35978.1 hypothetical protein GUITHDRAFT_146124 [Guillardia theta CCMP2712]|eukprot:XP_005822958.1 hypothetical protein GUITHDRAFT_146124 [Guillardia theta CCMP2712]